jgi:HPt (histidine-containing phosphotransfer) domain-containing protein
MNDYVPKPIRAEILVRKVQEWMDRNKVKQTKRTQSEQVHTHQEEGNAKEKSIDELITVFDIIDQEIVQQLADSVGGDMSFVNSILEGFIEEAEEQIANARTGYRENDCRTVQSELHTLKGNSGTLGAMRLHEITRIIEEKAKVCNFEHFEEEFSILENVFTTFKKAYAQMKF